MKPLRSFGLVVLMAAAMLGLHAHAQQDPSREQFRFRTGVELINVTATVTDANGRFVPGLRKEDFQVYQDDQPQVISHFTSERVPVSLGILLDTSGSMDGEKMVAAKAALNRFLLDLLHDQDEVFLYTFDSSPELVHEWTTDRARVSRALNAVEPRGGTAMYDALAEAVPLALAGRHRKKALVVISDGNDTSSRTAIDALKAQIRETEILVYAIGIDTQIDTAGTVGRPWRGVVGALFQGRGRPIPFPFPRPGTRRPRPPARPPVPPGTPPVGGAPPIGHPPILTPRSPTTRTRSTATEERVNVAALREITDTSGGRTEVVRSARDLNPATAGIADELSRQYYLGYAFQGEKDGRWHAIRVEVRDGRYQVRARRGFVAAR
jgi:Mg-chelatase subunit ChlD